MKKESMKGYVITFVISVVLAIVLGSFFGNQLENSRPVQDVVEIATETIEENGNDYFRIALPKDCDEGKFISFPTRHFETEVRIDGKVVYSLKAGNAYYNKSTGYHWNFVELKAEDAGKEIEICLIPVYDNIYPDGEIYYGEKTAICKQVIKRNGARFALAILIFIVGIVLLVYSLFIVEKSQRDETLIHFSIFSLLLAIWSVTESPICDLISVWSVYNLVFDHYALMIMPAAFMMFMRRLFGIKNNKLWTGYAHFNIMVVAIRTLLQVTTLQDLKESLWLTQLSIIVFAIIGTSWAVQAVCKGHLSRAMKQNLFWILLLLATTMIELFVFIVLHKSNVIGMIGFACYIIAMSVEMVRKSRKQMRHTQEAELYRKLAFTDELTGTYNRTAFGRDMEDCMTVNEKTGKQLVRPTTLFMLDLNDLKMCNDNYGHERGDQYIKMVAEALLNVIGVDGKCYRIGGDEFCVILPTNFQNEIDHKLIQIISELEELDRAGFVVPVSVAVGYATFNPEYDENLEDTMKRADTLMYQNKQMIKKNRQKEEEENSDQEETPESETGILRMMDRLRR